MKKRLWIGITAAAVAVILGLLFFGGFFLPKEARAYNKAVAQLKKQDSSFNKPAIRLRILSDRSDYRKALQYFLQSF